jgi:hypothetical protein
MKYLLWAAAAALFLVVLLWATTALSQDYSSHDIGHNYYAGWSSRVTDNCCNNRDCRELANDEWRETESGTEINIDGT